jgi:hypothetical protein
MSWLRKLALRPYMIPVVGASETMLENVMSYISIINFLLIKERYADKQ